VELQSSLEASKVTEDGLQGQLAEATSSVNKVSPTATNQLCSPIDHSNQLKMEYGAGFKEKDDLICALQKQLIDQDHELVRLQ